MTSVVVRGRIPGRTEPGEVRLEIATGATARNLIGAAVAAQLGAGRAAWADSSRLYLSDEEITEMAARGVIRFGTRDEAEPAVAAATARAVEAFRRGVFVMFAGASRVEGLDDVLPLRDGDRVVFLRMTALVGG